MRILITGAHGMLGSALKRTLLMHDITAPEKHQLNVGNIDQVEKYAKKIDLIIHLAAETDHEYCEQNPSQAYFINVSGTGNMVAIAKRLDIPILYMSTASIFNGILNKPYKTWNKPCPLNHYNKSKYYGELIVQSHPKHFIVRAGWMFGGGATLDKKFVNKIIKKINAGETEIKVADDCIGSPTYTEDLATCILSLLDSDEYGIYHCVHPGEISRYHFAKSIIEILGIEKEVKIIPVSIEDIKDEFPCKRTNYEVLESSWVLRDYKDALRSYIDDYFRP